MLYVRPRKQEKPKGGWYVYHKNGYQEHIEYFNTLEEVEEYFDFLEYEKCYDPELMARVRVYPALSWRVRNLLVDEDGDVSFLTILLGTLLVFVFVLVLAVINHY